MYTPFAIGHCHFWCYQRWVIVYFVIYFICFSMWVLGYMCVLDTGFANLNTFLDYVFSKEKFQVQLTLDI